MKQNPIYVQQQQVEKLQELGSCLRQIREKQAVSLEEVAEKTRIQSRLLKAIEEGRLEQLPEPVYIRGFLRKFADALGLNGTEFSHAFPASSVGFQLLRPTWRHLPVGQLRPVHLYLMYIALVMCAVSGLSYVVNRSAVQVSDRETFFPQPSHQLFGNTELTLSDSSEKLGPLVPAVANYPSQDGKPVRVGVTLQSQSWIRIVADGKTQFEGVLPEGTQRTWVANQELVVRAGNAGGVLVAFNDEKAKKLGDLGQVNEVTFAASRRS